VDLDFHLMVLWVLGGGGPRVLLSLDENHDGDESAKSENNWIVVMTLFER
jgi:hypothetical protein